MSRRFLAQLAKQRPRSAPITASCRLFCDHTKMDQSPLPPATRPHYVTEGWNLRHDNWFADVYLKTLVNAKIIIADTEPGDSRGLCSACDDPDTGFLSSRFVRHYAKLNHESCELCRIFHQYGSEFAPHFQRRLEFRRKPDSYSIRDTWGRLNLSVFAGPNSNSTQKSRRDIPLGLPILPAPGSRTHIHLLKTWLHHCDINHDCQPAGKTGRPSRLIDVGNKEYPNQLRLECSPVPPSERYVALSYQWGHPQVHSQFCTYRHNIEQLRNSIDYRALPQTYKDAVDITRSLGIRYVWIDALCIIQKDQEDWQAESSLMEDVYSGAYVRLAAVSSSGTTDGFLNQRQPRPTSTKLWSKSLNTTLHVRQAMDNFAGDVESSMLNKRGWVFQERALSRRTIYFTGNQAYWECGHGIRCETLSRLSNPDSSILGDAHFPDASLSQLRDAKIQFFQKLYRQYSRLIFTVPTDRVVGMAGLEKRLARAYDTPGKFGLLHDFLHRGLLWTRPQDSLDLPIIDRSVPSWSWMGVQGSIEYMNLPFGVVKWNGRIRSPFVESTFDEAKVKLRDLKTPAFDLDLDGVLWVSLDRPRESKGYKGLKGVLVGTRTRDDGVNLAYVLVIAPADSTRGPVDYFRVGVAIVEREEGMDESTREVRVL
ncbi:TOL protein [Cladorrhinum sp. PSN332]|nr:TOL protein [Cladorrhinum sp. PSN332]